MNDRISARASHAKMTSSCHDWLTRSNHTCTSVPVNMYI